jgi:uncharacterized protein involved in tellurium resistance
MLISNDKEGIEGDRRRCDFADGESRVLICRKCIHISFVLLLIVFRYEAIYNKEG